MRPVFPDREPAHHDAIIFDCDGTLADTMGLHFVAWTAATQRYGLSLSRERFFAMAGVPTRRIVEALAVEASVSIDVDAVCELREQLFMQHIGRIEPVEVVADVARRWRGRVPMAIASGSLREVVCQTIAQLGMSDWFDPVLGAEDSVLSKPAPDIFLLAARKMGVAPARCLVYEDSDKGLLAARAAGMHGVDVRPWHTPQVTPILG